MVEAEVEAVAEPEEEVVAVVSEVEIRDADNQAN